MFIRVMPGWICVLAVGLAGCSAETTGGSGGLPDVLNSDATLNFSDSGKKPDGAAPKDALDAGVDGGDPSRHGIREDDRDAVRRRDDEEDVRTTGDQGVAFSEEDAPALARRFFEGEDPGAVHLLKAHRVRVRCAESVGQRACRDAGVDGADRQGAAREARGEARRTGKVEPRDEGGALRAGRRGAAVTRVARRPLHSLILGSLSSVLPSRIAAT